MDTNLIDRCQRATAELSGELLAELESANEAVELAKRAEAKAVEAEERAAQVDRQISKRLAEVKDELQRAQSIALDAAIDGSTTFSETAANYGALEMQIALLEQARSRHSAFSVLEARTNSYAAQRELAKVQKRAAHIEYDYTLNELMLIEQAKARINGATALNEASFDTGRARQLRNAIIRFDDIETSLTKALEKHSADAIETRREYLKGLNK